MSHVLWGGSGCIGAFPAQDAYELFLYQFFDARIHQKRREARFWFKRLRRWFWEERWRIIRWGWFREKHSKWWQGWCRCDHEWILISGKRKSMRVCPWIGSFMHICFNLSYLLFEASDLCFFFIKLNSKSMIHCCIWYFKIGGWTNKSSSGKKMPFIKKYSHCWFTTSRWL